MKKSDFFSQDLRSSNRLLSLRHHKDIRYPAPSTYSKQKPAKRGIGGVPMSGSVEVVLWLHEYELKALDKHLASNGTDVEKTNAGNACRSISECVPF